MAVGKRRVVRRAALMTADIIALCLSYLIAGFSVVITDFYSQNVQYGDLFASSIAHRPAQMLVLGLALIAWFHHRGHYSLRLPAWTDVRHVLGACAFIMLLHGFTQFALKDAYSRLWLLSSWAIAVPALICGRRLVGMVLNRLGLWEMPVLMVGTPGCFPSAVTMLTRDQSLACRISTMLDLSSLSQEWQGSWAATCSRHGAEMVVVAADDADLVACRSLIARLSLEGVPFIRIQGVSGLPAAAMEAHYAIGQDMLLLLGNSPLSRPLGQIAKRSLDIVGALAILVFAAPLILGLSVILLCQGGGVIYGHRRIGMDGKPFGCLKFRSMVPDAEARLQEYLKDPERLREWEETRKLRDDPRITAFGRALRRWSLDELPQLFNVLLGQMSLVGPRPVTAEELEKSGSDHPLYYHVRPGLTGLWQVSGRNDLDLLQRAELDTWYVINWSLWLDAVILVKTIPAVFGRHGAY